MNWLSREIYAQYEASDAERRLTLFREIGIPGSALVALRWPTALWPIQPLSDGRLYEPATDRGREAIIIPYVEPGGVVIDLVAFRADQPSRWWQRTGTATALGEQAVEQADWPEEPLSVYPDPLAWLRAECRGAVILEPAAAGWVLAGLKTVITRGPDLKIALDVERWLRQPTKLPEIRVSELV